MQMYYLVKCYRFITTPHILKIHEIYAAKICVVILFEKCTLIFKKCKVMFKKSTVNLLGHRTPHEISELFIPEFFEFSRSFLEALCFVYLAYYVALRFTAIKITKTS